MAVSPSALYLLDTNTVSYIANDRSPAARRTLRDIESPSRTAVSAITQGELLYGLARKPDAVKIHRAVHVVLANVEILPWDSQAARTYGDLRAQISALGKALTPLDTLIAAHAIATNAVLVTSDKALSHIEALQTVNWATDL
jgi:tRNA(fMet)-specific endonuclease VapC